MHFPHYSIPITVDGYAGHSDYEIRQRCWAHILHEAEYEAHDCRQLHTLYDEMWLLFHDAKMAASKPDAALQHGEFTIRACAIAQQYKEEGCRFAVKLNNAIPYLFTFLLYPGMEPTNNLAERMLRLVVIARKVRNDLMIAGGMKMFGILMSCVLIWRRRRLNTTEKLLEILGST